MKARFTPLLQTLGLGQPGARTDPKQSRPSDHIRRATKNRRGKGKRTFPSDLEPGISYPARARVLGRPK
jgi:hypothetical protein